MNSTTPTKGFTIIEVILVLAIAGLIFLMVFLALPTLLSNQRDGARKSDATTVLSAVTGYSSNNRGAYPTTSSLTGNSSGTPNSDGKFGGYIAAVGNNTTSVEVRDAVITSDTKITVTDGKIIVVKQARCGDAGKDGSDPFYNVTKGTAREFSVITYLEAGGGSAFCQDS